MKKLTHLFIFTFIVQVVIINAQLPNDTLGWIGTEIIDPDEFYDTLQWTFNAAAGNTLWGSSTDSSLSLHWRIQADSQPWVQCYYAFATAISLEDVDIFGFDLMGDTCSAGNSCHNDLLLEIKFENGGGINAVFNRRGEECILNVNRWIEKLFILKDDDEWSVSPGFRWDSITIFSLAIRSIDGQKLSVPDSGVVSFRRLVGDNTGEWNRIYTRENLTVNQDTLTRIRNAAANFILSRQTDVGLITTWEETGFSYLYGQGLALMVLTEEGQWNSQEPGNAFAQAANNLAHFLADNQLPGGYWPRCWNSNTGQSESIYEAHDSTIWMGDFPWMITSLSNYYKKSHDAYIRIALDKAIGFLRSLVDSNGKFYTLNVFNLKKKEVTSTEAYIAGIRAMYEADTVQAVAMRDYIMGLVWHNDLHYWKEGNYSDRVVLFANTWMAQISEESIFNQYNTDALSFVGKILYTRGPGSPFGFDGIGPIATWYEGTLSYICAGGPGSNTLFENIRPYINADGSVPHYNDTIGAKAAIWAVKWPSLDGTSWLYYAASGRSPLHRNEYFDYSAEEEKKVLIHYMGWFGDSVSDNVNEFMRMWQCGHTYSPLIGTYDSWSWALLTYHILLSWSCGIDGLAINLKDDIDDGCMKRIIPAIKNIKNISNENFDYEFAMSYDDQGMDQIPPHDTAAFKLNYLKETILEEVDNDYLHYLGKPVIFVYNYQGIGLSSGEFRNVTNEIWSDNIKPMIFWNSTSHPEDSAVNIDAYYPWVQPGLPNTPWDTLHGLNWGKPYLDYFYNYVNNTNDTFKLGIMCCGVWAGFNDTLNTCWNTDMDRWIDREDSAVYDSTWNYVHQYNSVLPLKYVVIETWNDWNEGSQIEPGIEYKYKYLTQTQKQINQFKNTAVDLDTCIYYAAWKIYEAACSIEQKERDSSEYYPVLMSAINAFLDRNCEQSVQYSNQILHPTGLGENIPDKNCVLIEAFPNPAYSKVEFSIEAPELMQGTFSILDLNGRVINTLFQGTFYAGEKKKIIWMPDDFAKGMYLYELKTNKLTRIRKLIIL